MSLLCLMELNIPLRFAKPALFWPLIPPELRVLNLIAEMWLFFTPGDCRVSRHSSLLKQMMMSVVVLQSTIHANKGIIRCVEYNVIIILYDNVRKVRIEVLQENMRVLRYTDQNAGELSLLSPFSPSGAVHVELRTPCLFLKGKNWVPQYSESFDWVLL